MIPALLSPALICFLDPSWRNHSITHLPPFPTAQCRTSSLKNGQLQEVHSLLSVCNHPDSCSSVKKPHPETPPKPRVLAPKYFLLWKVLGVILQTSSNGCSFQPTDVHVQICHKRQTFLSHQCFSVTPFRTEKLEDLQENPNRGTLLS